MTIVRLLADDLTGALDTASELMAIADTMPVWWRPLDDAPAGSFAYDSETRDAFGRCAIERVGSVAHVLTGADVAYKKIDSLLRGNTAAEVATCFASGDFRSAIVCPAFPAQGRVTRHGRHYFRSLEDPKWHPVPTDLPAQLRNFGHTVRVVPRATPLSGAGIVVSDAETDEDLRAIAASGNGMEPPVLWCGSAGLASVLTKHVVDTPLSHVQLPLLMIIGSDHPVSRTQIRTLEACRPGVIAILQSDDADHIGRTALSTRALLAAAGVGAVALAFPERTPFARLERVMRSLFARLAEALPPPASVFASGGATLHRLAETLGATELRMVGRLSPGVPVARFSDGAWRGADIISKSGAFGPPAALADLVEQLEGRPYVTA